MEDVHRANLRPWISPKISIRQFQDEWLKTQQFNDSNDFKAKLSQSLNLTKKELKFLEDQCMEEVLDCPDEDLIGLENEAEIPEDTGLTTIQCHKKHLEKKKKDSRYRSLVYSNSRLNNFPPQIIANPESLDSDSNCSVTYPDVVLLVQFHRPEKRCNSFQRQALARTPCFQVDKEFLVLGSQCLTELRDKIDCVSDMTVSGDYSEDPTVPTDATCKDLYKSGFFYINGIFYNDMRDPDCRDYSETIIKWSAETAKGIGPFQKALMEKTKFVDLTLQLGYPYVYVHQGCCEHLMVFNDLCMLGNHSRDRSKYPMYVSLGPKKRVFCRVCHLYTATWVVYDNKRLPENPFFFCEACLTGFNYTSEGEKEGEFRAYHFPDRTYLT